VRSGRQWSGSERGERTQRVAKGRRLVVVRVKSLHHLALSIHRIVPRVFLHAGYITPQRQLRGITLSRSTSV
jgi:hypothetical protein